MKPIVSILLLSSSLLLACRTAKKNKPEYQLMDTISVSAHNNPMNIFRASAPRLWNIVHTRVALSFDYQNRTAKGQEWITLQPYFYPSDTLRLDAKSMNIESVTIGHLDKPLSYTYDSSSLFIKLDKRYSKEELVKLCIKYEAMPYASVSGGSAAIKDDRGLYFINHDGRKEAKPIQIWTQGETESNSHWLPTIDKPNSRTTIQLELTVPSQFKTLGIGELISSMDKGYLRTDIWKMDKPIQIYAIMFAIGDFAVVKDKWRNKEVNYYVEPDYAPYAAKMFQHTPEMMELFSNLTGLAYPWNKYSQVVVRDYVSGAMENTSASLFGEFMNQDHREYADANHEDVVSHELFHQWFGDYVTAESWSHLTLNESFATYGEYLWRRYKYGQSYADELAYSDLHRYLDNADYNEVPLVRHHYRDKEDMFDRVSYQKGGAILHYLHHLMGDSAFYQSMKIYLTKNALQAAEADNWRMAVEEATGKDWNWFFDEWYHRPGHPILDIQYQYDDAAQNLTVNIVQTQKEEIGIYILPLQVLLINGNTKSFVDWTINKRKQSFVYHYVDAVRPVIVPDIAHVLPGIIQEHKTYKEWLSQMTHSTDFVSQLQAIESIQKKDINQSEVQAILSKGLEHSSAALRNAALAKISLVENEELRQHWKSQIVSMATHESNNDVRASALLDCLGKWKMKEHKELMIAAVADSSYLVAGSALKALSYIDDSMAYLLAKKNISGKANTFLDQTAWGITARKGNAEDTILFKKLAQINNDRQIRKLLKLHLMEFANNTRSEQSFRCAVDLLALQIKSIEQKNYREDCVNYLKLIKDTKVLALNKDKKSQQLQSELNYLKSKISELNAEEKEADIKEAYQRLLK